jgi:hypothetical protein
VADAPSRPLALASRIAASFEESAIPYAIGGALALGVWGAQRATKDVDMSVFVDESELPRVLDALERSGLMVDRAAAATDVRRVGMFKAFGGKTQVDLFLTAHPQYEAMHQRRRAIVEAHSGQSLYFISPEDLSVHKLIFGRDKDVMDLQSLFAAQPDLDLGYVRHWLTQMLPAGDARFAILDDLERRFARK